MRYRFTAITTVEAESQDAAYKAIFSKINSLRFKQGTRDYMRIKEDDSMMRMEQTELQLSFDFD